MIRSKRRVLRPTDPTDITPAMAAEFERTRWPSLRQRWAFWHHHPAVPADLRYEPDPRLALSSPEAAEALAQAWGAWKRRRREWLAKEAGNG